MGSRGRRRAREAGGKAAPVATTDYRDGEGNVLTLRDELSPGTLGQLERLDASPASSAEDRWQRRAEFLFERLAVRWELAGLPLESRRSCWVGTAWPAPTSAAGCVTPWTST